MHGSLTETDSQKIENVQKKVFKLILQLKYVNYQKACEFFNTDSLQKRRETLCLKFFRKELLKDNSLFKKYQPKIVNRHTSKKIVQEITCNTDRYFNSSLPYLSRLLNADHARKT